MKRLIIAASLLLVPVIAFSHPLCKKEKKSCYKNPVIEASIPDPTVIRAKNGSFYLMGTEDIHNMAIFKSKDLVTWKQVGFAFTEATRPTFIPGGMMWAPEANYIDGKYVLYYTFANPVAGRFGIGAATSSKPEGPYTDKGKIIEQGVDVHTGGITIDQFFYSEGGHNYLFYGCYGGIYYIELSKDGLTKLEGEPKQLMGSDYEGTMIHKHGDYYYYFGSLNGYQTNYQLAVARSKSLLGPYMNKEGKPAMEHGGFEVVLTGSDVFSNPGHCSKIITDDAGNDWIFVHAYTAADKNNDRCPHLYRVTWDSEGWPVVNNDGRPSELVNEVPAIKR